MLTISPECQHHDYTLYDPSEAIHASVGSCSSVCADGRR